MNVVVRTTADPLPLIPAVRGAVRELDANLPIQDVARLRDLAFGVVGDQRRSATSLLSVLSLIAVVLGAIGVHGLVSFAVSRRAREMGVRLALGATPLRLLVHVLGQGVRLAALGVVIGWLAALVAARLFAHLLDGVSEADPLTLGGGGLLLVVVAGVASAVATLVAGRETRPFSGS